MMKTLNLDELIERLVAMQKLGAGKQEVIVWHDGSLGYDGIRHVESSLAGVEDAAPSIILT